MPETIEDVADIFASHRSTRVLIVNSPDLMDTSGPARPNVPFCAEHFEFRFVAKRGNEILIDARQDSSSPWVRHSITVAEPDEPVVENAFWDKDTKWQDHWAPKNEKRISPSTRKMREALDAGVSAADESGDLLEKLRLRRENSSAAPLIQCELT
jgi:hypothetical protein